jgi:hypothetical protein
METLDELMSAYIFVDNGMFVLEDWLHRRGYVLEEMNPIGRNTYVVILTTDDTMVAHVLYYDGEEMCFL